MRRALVVVFAFAGAVFLCFGNRVDVEYATLGWIGAGLLVLGGLFGAAQAHARRNWAEYQHYRRQVPVARRVFIGSTRAVVGWALVVAAVVVLYLVGRR